MKFNFLRFYKLSDEQNVVKSLIMNYKNKRFVAHKVNSLVMNRFHFGKKAKVNGARGGSLGTVFVNFNIGLMYNIGN